MQPYQRFLRVFAEAGMHAGGLQNSAALRGEPPETRGHIQWLIKKAGPVMKSAGPEKEEVDIQGIFDGIDTSSLADVKTAIAMKDPEMFAASYKIMLESCYACHKSVGRPYIRPMIPTQQVQSIVNMDPNATWPQ